MTRGWLLIGGALYEFWSVEPGVAQVVWRVKKWKGGRQTYTVDRHVVTPDEGPRRSVVECTCPDFTYRKVNSPFGCKHVRAFQEMRMV